MFDKDEVERRLKEALHFALEEAVIDESLSVDASGPFPILTQYSLETNEPIAKFEIRFDIKQEEAA